MRRGGEISGFEKGNVDDLSENSCRVDAGCVSQCVGSGGDAGRSVRAQAAPSPATWLAPVDFPCILDELEIHDDFSTTGNVIIDGLIGVGGEDEPLEVEDDAVIGGALIISPTGQVSAWDADAGNEAEAEATAVTIDSDEAPRFVNNGVVEAEAEADAAGGLLFDAEADADAKGIEHDGEELAEDDQQRLD